VIVDLGNEFGAEPCQPVESLPGRRQQERYIGNSVVGSGKADRLLHDARAKAKMPVGKNQTEIPFFAFFLKTSPSGIDAVAKYCSMAQPIAIPAIRQQW
jgi:hypothetical protein